MKKTLWTTDDIPDQEGKVIVITGATSGLGKEATKVLTRKNATVIMAVRNTKKGESVLNEMKKELPAANVFVMELNLANLSSLKAFSEKVLAKFKRLDVLINNAGIMMCPYALTKNGFEIQMGTNHLGHFALTGLLMPLLKKTPNARIVVTSSLSHSSGNINFDDIHWKNRTYDTGQAYADSKLANMYFAYELARRFESTKNPPRVTCAHPGWTKTELQENTGIIAFFSPLLAQGVDKGVLPTLRAAFDASAKPGDYFGPAKFFEMRGNPVLVKSSKQSYDEEAAKRLWNLSEKLTGLSY